MPVRKNPVYADPYMAQAAQNVASLFAPEDPSKIAAGALHFQQAAAERDKAARVADLYAKSLGPAPDMGALDRGSVIANLYDPSQSYRALDIKAETDRYGYDTTARTSLATNAADNARALRTNELDNQRHAVVGLHGPLNEGQVRPAISPELMHALNLPGIVQAEGRDKRPSETEALGAALQSLPLPMQQNRALAGSGTQDIIDPLTGQLRVQSNAGAIGMQPAPGKADQATEITRLIAERDRLPAADQNRKAYDARIAALGRGQQQSAYDKETDEAFAKENGKINAQANAARTQLGSLHFMRQLLANPETQQGFGGETALQARKALEALGMPVGNTTDAEVARALSNKLALYAKNEGGENLMPGALSDSDRPFLQQQVAGLGNTRGANMKLLDYYERIQRRAIEVEGLRQAYVQRNGRIDEGFRRELSTWAEANPVFPEARPRTSAGTPAPGTPPAPDGSPAPAGAAGGKPQFRVLNVR
jgi:hypothetical protein